MESQNSYQNQIWELQKQIFRCNDCQSEFPPNYLGPDSIFVGSQYGLDPSIPKILFIGINPNSLENEFGTRFNTDQIYESNYESDVNSAQYYQDFFNGIGNYGGFKNINIFCNSWGIRRLMTGLFNFEGTENYFAMTNAIQCTGSGSDGFPSRLMINNCIQRRWLRKTIEILIPDIIFIFSVGETRDSTWNLFTSENGIINNEDLTPITPTDWNMIPEIQTPSGTIQPLTFAIPHFARSNLSANCFNEIRNDLRMENGSVNWDKFIDMIKFHIRENTSYSV